MRIIGGRQREQAEFIHAGAAPALLGDLENLIDASHAHGALGVSRVAKPAALRAAAHDLDADAVVYDAHVRHQRPGWERRVLKIGRLAAFDRCRQIVAQRFDACDPMIRSIAHVVKSGCINPLEAPRQLVDHIAPAHAAAFHFLTGRQNGGQRFLAVADDDQVQKRRHWFRVVSLRPAGDDQRVRVVPFGTAQRDARQIEQRQRVCEAHFILQ